MLVRKRSELSRKPRERVRETSIFTTHTPLTAGTDVFPFPLFEKYFSHAYQRFGTDRDTLLQLGVFPPDPGAGFNMTAFALRMTKFTNAVSKKHGEVARQMWTSIWPDKKQEESPDRGDHQRRSSADLARSDLAAAACWTAISVRIGFAIRIAPGIWELVRKIPDVDLWRLRRRLKGLLIDEINERARERWQNKRVRAESVIAFGALLEPEVFTIGFARRFTGYKRPDLILTDHRSPEASAFQSACVPCRSSLPANLTRRTSRARGSFKEFSDWRRIPISAPVSPSLRITTSISRSAWCAASTSG